MEVVVYLKICLRDCLHLGVFSQVSYTLCSDKAFNKICKLKEGTKAGEFYVTSAVVTFASRAAHKGCSCAFVLRYSPTVSVLQN